MADQASSSITIAATKQQVLAVIGDIPRYPEWAGQIKQAEVLDAAADGRPRQARFVLDAGMIRDEYTLDYEWSADGVSWQLAGPTSVQRSQVGSYHLVEVAGGTEVTYRLTVDIVLPMIGLFKRKAEKIIIDSALKELKRRVEAPA